MARVIWRGSIGFGLVQIPVGLYTAEKRSALSFTLLDDRDMSPIGYRKVNKNTGEEVPPEHVVKGHEVGDGEMIVVAEEDFEAANVEANQTVDILDFVDVAAVDVMLFDKPYYLAPLERGKKPYALLREALRKGGKAGIAKVVIRSKQHLAALLVRGDVLVLELMRFAHEMRSPEELTVPGNDLKELGVKDRELKMAHKLVDELTVEWDHTRYADDYEAALLARIEEKAKKGAAKPARRPAAAGGAEVVDLMSLLEKSVEQADGRREAGGGAKGRGRRRTGAR